MSRPKKHATPWIEFQASHLQITNQYYAKYEAISRILDENTGILDLVHRDLKKAFQGEKPLAGRRRKAAFQYFAENLLRVLLCQVIEGFSLREIVVRIDDSHCLRRFTRMGTGPMMDFTTLDRLRNAIRPGTWKTVNQLLAKYAIHQDLATGDSLRLDTTAVETNIHFPTDSALLWDGYRTLARLIEQAREIDSKAVGIRRLQTRCVKRLYIRITRTRRHKSGKLQALKLLYRELIDHLEGTFSIGREMWPHPWESAPEAVA